MTYTARLLNPVVLTTGLLIAGCAVSQTATETGAPLARQVAQSAHCGLVAPGQVRVSSVAEVDRMASLPAQNLPLGPLRAIDFSREHLVFAALGQKPTGGYGVTLAGSEIVDDRLQLSVTITEPAAGDLVSQALTTPCAVIAVTAQGWTEIQILRAQNNR